jgi:hypothetical protein
MESLRSNEARSGYARIGRVALYSIVVLAILLVDCRPASALPAFARKYGMPCSACHEAWPMLSPFGQQFKDNGYQMGNDRDAPIFQQAAYWPVTFRITPQWHRESTNKAQVDGSNGPGGNEAQVTTHGFDWSGLDFHTGGTLARTFRSTFCRPRTIRGLSTSRPFGRAWTISGVTPGSTSSSASLSSTISCPKSAS